MQFEVHGKVQGVFFRKYTKIEADKLGVKGWCLNTERGTVTGDAVGSASAIAQFKHWLGFVGSPKSSIAKLDIIIDKEAAQGTSFANFEIRK